MRFWLSLFFSLICAGAAQAEGIDVRVKTMRTFGYFVGDLIPATVEIAAPDDRKLLPASLPHPGPLGVSLSLRGVGVREVRQGGKRVCLIDLLYQNFYVALDVRNIDIPGFELHLGDEVVRVPSWSVSISPLREIAPGLAENAKDYLRPDGPPVFADDANPGLFALGAAVLAAASLLPVARDRGLAPFHRRRARAFNALAHSLRKGASTATDAESFREALRSVHRAIDALNDASLLAEDVPAFLSSHPEFASLRADFDRFYEVSRRTFFGAPATSNPACDFPQLLQFVSTLARLERAR